MLSVEERLSKLEGQVELLVRLMSDRNWPPAEAPPSGKGNEEMMREFTPKQHAVMQMIASGVSTQEMAAVMEVAESTVKVHIRGIMKRTGTRTRAQIAMWFERSKDDCDAQNYETFAGIPQDWYENLDKYADVTKMLRVRTR